MLTTSKHLVLLCGALLMACSGRGAEAGSAPAVSTAAVEPAAAPAKAPEVAPTPSIQENNFRLALEAEPTYGGGKSGQFRVVLTALGGYHVNLDYPIRVELKAPAALGLKKATLGKADAAQFAEKAARFEVSFAAPKGTHPVAATVDFAVCTKETCVPDLRTVALNLQVN